MKKTLTKLLIAGALFLSPYQSNAQTPKIIEENPVVSFIRVIQIRKSILDHAEDDYKRGVPVKDIVEHIEKYHDGIGCIETRRVGWERPYMRRYSANDGSQFVHVGISKDDFVPDTKTDFYLIVRLPKQKW